MLRHVAYLAYAATLLYASHLVNKIVPEPYMDEIMHVGQARAYCLGEWRTWDSRLTTPPGLYVISAAVSRLLSSSARTVCDPPNLRRVNVAFMLVLPFIYNNLLSLVRHPILRSSTRGKVTPSKLALQSADQAEQAVEAVVMACFPVAAFFALLYYTDVGSLVSVLLSFQQGLRQRWWTSSLLGALSLTFRQTNIVWLAFIAATSVTRHLQAVTALHDPPLVASTALDLIKSPASLARQSLANWQRLIPAVLAYLPVFGLAAAFVKWNGGIVLGDKQNHVPVIHLAQLLYFMALTAMFMLPLVLSKRSLETGMRNMVGNARRVLQTLLAFITILWTIKRFTIVHPFLLSDNRHYTFYIWRRVVNVHPLARYVLAPGYLFAGRLILDHLVASGAISLLPAIFFSVASLLTLVPSPLIEPRYLIIPFIILRLFMRVPGSTRRARRRALAMEVALYMLVNVGTLWVFLYHPFRWDAPRTKDELGLMRFMW